MKTVISLFLVFSLKTLACDFSHPKVVGYSYPMNLIFQELDLLKSKKLYAVSNLHQLKGELKTISGGIYLSKAKLNSIKDSYIIFDESRELRKLFKKKRLKGDGRLIRSGPKQIVSSEQPVTHFSFDGEFRKFKHRKRGRPHESGRI